MDADARSATQRCYGRGLIEGLRLAGISNPGEFVNKAKMERIEKGLTGIARKVLDVVPIRETWNSTRIMQELARTGTKTDRRMVDGCLQSLKDSGLIKEPLTGNWVRVQAREAAEPNEVRVSGGEVDLKVEFDPAKPIPVNPVDTLADIANRMRSMASGLTKIAADIDEAALLFVEQAQQADKELAAVRQFKALMRQLGD